MLMWLSMTMKMATSNVVGLTELHMFTFVPQWNWLFVSNLSETLNPLIKSIALQRTNA